MNAAALRILVSKGLSAADILEVAEALERRSPGAERQAAYRERQRALRNDRDVTRDVTTTPRGSPPKENNQTPPPTPPETSKGARAHRLPTDWQPAPLSADTAAMVAAWQPGVLERELSKFRDHWRAASGANARKVDWDAAWRNWLRKADDGKRSMGGNSRSSGGRREHSALAGLRQAEAELEAERTAQGGRQSAGFALSGCGP